MTDSSIRADLTAEATEYILDRYGDRSMMEPTETRFQKLLLDFETSKRLFLNNDEVYVVKYNLRWVWDGIESDWLCPPADIRVEIDDSASGWKKKTEENKDD